ncbi:MAG: D-alanyl-D-alanine carboxypeptidase [Syntrophomonadaceae bacterium]|nr:D-alanyl-D-alanine carboxypeptidase [Syntrophomonadaceae bacterium]
MQKSRLICTLLLIIFSLTLIPANLAAAAETIAADDISTKAYILIDADSGKVLKSRNAHQRLAPASMTKLMTMLLALEAIDEGTAHKTDQVTSSEYAASMDGTRIYLEPGEMMTLDDMLKAMALASANDASVAVAEHLAGSEKAFVEQMNRKAQALGMKDTCFKNVSGMPAEGHYSSAYDMALLAKYTLAHTSITDYTSLKQDALRDGEFPMYNSNRLLWRYAGTDGLKTGYTSEAKNCLTATAKRGKLRLITVVMGCPFRGGHTQAAMSLLDYGFDHYSCKTLMAKSTVCGTVKVKGGTAKEVPAVVPDEVNAICLNSSRGNLTRSQDLLPHVKAPVKSGQKVGEILIFDEGKLLKRVDLRAGADIPRLTLAGRILHMPWGFKILIILIMTITYLRHRNSSRDGS